jgi:hypothetical protein
MLRIIVALLVAASFVTSGLAGKEVGGAPAQSLRTAMIVKVSFGGLMVFNPSLSGGYEVGVLVNRKDVAPGHKLRVLDVRGKDVPLGPLGDSETWSFSITNSSPGVQSTTIKPGQTERKTDDWEGQYDLRWMIDLHALHPDVALQLESGRLNPIIRLKEGTLYSRYKTEFMQSVQGKTVKDLGFFTETAALRLEIPPGEKLVLSREDSAGKETTIYELPYAESPEDSEVWVKNIRDSKDPHSDESDFRLYYNIFKAGTVPAPLQYDFQLKPGENGHPYNPVPKPAKDMSPMRANQKKGQLVPLTCCGLDCNIVMLSGIALN